MEADTCHPFIPLASQPYLLSYQQRDREEIAEGSFSSHKENEDHAKSLRWVKLIAEDLIVLKIALLCGAIH